MRADVADIRHTMTVILRHIWIPVVVYIVLLPAGTLYNVPLLALSFLGMLYTWQNRATVADDEWIRRFVILFLCIWIPMVISLPDAVNFSRSAAKTLSFVLYFFMGVPVILGFREERQRRLFISFTGMLMVLWCLDAAWQAYSGTDLLGFPHRGQLTGVFYPSVRLGLMLALLSPFYFEFIRYGSSFSWWAILLLIPFLYIIVFAGNKNSWVLLLLSAFMYMVFLYLNRSRLRTGRAVAMTVAAVFLGVLVLANVHKLVRPETISIIEGRMHSMLSLAAGDLDKAGASFTQRIRIWEGGLRVGRDHWFNGVGPRGFRYSVEEHTGSNQAPVLVADAKQSTHPHQYMLEIFVETGVVGLTGFLVFIFLIVLHVCRVFRNRQYVVIPWLIPMLLVTFPLSMHKSFYGSDLAPLIWLLVAMALSVMASTNEIAGNNRINGNTGIGIVTA